MISNVANPDSIDLRREAELAPEIRSRGPVRPRQTARSVLLTGATGFVGVHILAALLERGLRAVCLTRAGSNVEAHQRVMATLDRYHVSLPGSAAFDSIAADLSQPRLGLSSAEFEALGERVDIIIHCGAAIHLSKPYEALRPTNVWGTREILRLAATGTTKTICHISGMSVFIDAQSMRENAPPLMHGRHGGYFDTKWVSERMVWHAFERGIPGVVVRLGWVSGDSRHGLTPDSDAMTLFIKTCIRMGAAPRLPQMSVGCTPADIAGQVIARAAIDGSSELRGCNLAQTHVLGEENLWGESSAIGSPIELLPHKLWLEKLERRFPMLLPLAHAVLEDRSLPACEDAHARSLVGALRRLPSETELLAVYGRVWGRVHGPSKIQVKP